MAISNILGLFTSPEQYQAQQLAQQQANEQARAINFAGLSPLQQANYGTFLGAQQLGRGFAGLLGVQDPQLQRIRQRDQLMQSINPADPESLMAGIRAATNAGDQELAISLATYLREAEGNIALAAQRTAQANRERVQALPAGIQEAARIAEIERELPTLDPNSTAYKALVAERTRLQRSAKAATSTEKQREAEAYANTVSDNPDSAEWKEAYKTRLDRLQLGKDAESKSANQREAEAYANTVSDDPKSAQWKEAYKTRLDRLQLGAEPKDKEMSFGVDREATAMSEFGKRFSELTQDQQKTVNKLVDTEQRARAPKLEVKNVLPKEPVDIAKTEAAIRTTVEPQLRTVTTVDSALATLALAKKDNNPSAFNAARVQLARSLGDSTLSAADIRNAGGDPSILGTIRDTTSTVVFGTPGNPTLDAVEKTLKAIRKVARKQATNTLDRQKRLARSATFNDGTKIYTEDQIKDLFDFPDLNPGKPAGEAKPGGSNKAVDFNSLPK